MLQPSSPSNYPEEETTYPSAIQASVAGSIAPLISSCATVAEAWYKLQTTFTNHSRTLIGRENRRCLRGRGGHMHVVCMQRWLATARPPAVAASHGLATYKGRPAAAKAPLQGGGRPQGQQPARGCRPRTALPPAGMAAPWQGRLPTIKGSHRLRRGSGSDINDVVRVKEG
ncbi:hypothetical protein GW17_00011710 [Ensete ventricosum]|nr:hypothetical protein GW17_00011710 [Ensete ventricosum]